MDIYDPYADPDEVETEFNLKILPHIDESIKYDGLILCVEHESIIKLGEQYWNERCNQHAIIFDLKAIFSQSFSDYRM